VQERGTGPPLNAPAGPDPSEPLNATAGSDDSDRSHRHGGLIVLSAAAVVALDQLTKWWALRALADEPIDLFWTLRLRLTFNTGAAFSLGAGRGGLIALVVVAVVAWMVWFARSAATRLGAVALGLVLGGAVGNLSDRIFRADDGWLSGAVVDFIDLQWWPVFNVADSAIVIGALLLFVASVIDSRPRDPVTGA
jgi:signal peptidase II